LSIEFGIANTHALGACFYVVCALMLVGSRQGLSAAAQIKGPGPVRLDEVVAAAGPLAPSIQPTQIELASSIETAETLAASVSPAVRTRADEVMK
jgi:hypothetical protein